MSSRWAVAVFRRAPIEAENMGGTTFIKKFIATAEPSFSAETIRPVAGTVSDQYASQNVSIYQRDLLLY